MKLKKYFILKEIIKNGYYTLNFDDYEIYNKKSKKIGYVWKNKDSVGLKIAKLRYNNRAYFFSVAEIVCFVFGIINEENCENSIVENISKNPHNTNISNLRVLSRKDFCKIQHIKKVLSKKYIENYCYKPISEKSILEIRQLRRMGFEIKNISYIMNLSKSTINKYLKKRMFS